MTTCKYLYLAALNESSLKPAVVRLNRVYVILHDVIGEGLDPPLDIVRLANMLIKTLFHKSAENIKKSDGHRVFYQFHF